jgi:hypothetical protein
LKGPLSIIDTNIAVTGGSGTGMTVDINATFATGIIGIGDISNYVTVNQGDNITNITNDITNIEGDITNLTTDVSDLQTDVSDLQSDKADKVTSATNGNFAGLDGSGNLTDSGSKAADFATAAQGAKADTAVQTSDLTATGGAAIYANKVPKLDSGGKIDTSMLPAAVLGGVASVAEDLSVSPAGSLIDNTDATNPKLKQDASKADKVVGFSYAIVINNAGVGYAAGDNLTVLSGGVTFNLTYNGSAITLVSPLKGPVSVIDTNVDVTGGSGTGMTVDINATSGAVLNLSDITNYVTVNQGDNITNITNDITNVQSDITTIQGNVTNLLTDVGDLQTDVGTLQTDVGTLQTDVGTLQTDVGTLQTDVSALQSGKADKVTSAIANNFAGLNASGNLIDSGKSASDFESAGAALAAQSAAISAAAADATTKANAAQTAAEATAAADATSKANAAKQDAISDAATKYVPLTEKATANGVATLGSDGKVLNSQLPATALGGVASVTDNVSGALVDNSDSANPKIKRDTTKVDKVTSAGVGNFARFVSGGGIEDSGKKAADFDLAGAAQDVQDNLDTHEARTDNPHNVTKSQVGLGNVDNTADTAKPVSTAQQTALNAKADKVSSATAGDLAGLDASGNLTDSGVSVSDISDIQALIPAQASSTNQLADKNFVASSVMSNVGTRLYADTSGSQFATRAALTAATTFYKADGTSVALSAIIEGSYTIITADEGAPSPFTNGQTRWLFSGGAWGYEFGINEEPFTAAEAAAIGSGVTSAKVSSYDTHIADNSIHVTSTDKTNWNAKYSLPSGGVPTADIANNAVTDAKIANMSVSDTSSDTATVTAKSLSLWLQQFYSNIKALLARFNTSTGHDHNGTNSKKVAYSDLTGTPTAADLGGLTAANKGETSSRTLTSGDTFKVLNTTSAGAVNETVLTLPTIPSIPSYLPNQYALTLPDGSTYNGSAAASMSAASASTNGYMNSTYAAALDFMTGEASVTLLAIDCATKQRQVVTLSAAATLSCTNTPLIGGVVHLLIVNSTAAAITLAIPNTGNYISRFGTTLSLPASNTVELDILYMNSKYILSKLETT